MHTIKHCNIIIIKAVIDRRVYNEGKASMVFATACCCLSIYYLVTIYIDLFLPSSTICMACLLGWLLLLAERIAYIAIYLSFTTHQPSKPQMAGCMYG